MEELPVVDFTEQDRGKHQKALKRKREKQRTKEPKNLKKPKIDYSNREDEKEGPGPGFGTAFATILGKATSSNPILPGVVPKHEPIDREAKALAKQKKLVKVGEKMLLDRSHVVLTYTNENWERESKHKKIATAGVVKLFNVVKAFQKEKAEAAAKKIAKRKKIN